MNTNYIYWIVGFLEGEGTFRAGRGGTLIARAVQVQKEPLDRLQSLLGGRLRLNIPTTPRSLYWEWTLDGCHAAGLLMTLYCLMSPKRQRQIKFCLNDWKAHKPYSSYLTHCKHGHEYTEENTIRFKSRFGRNCRICLAVRQKKYQMERRDRERAACLTT